MRAITYTGLNLIYKISRLFVFRRKKKLVIEALPKLYPLYTDYVKTLNKHKKRLHKQYGPRAGKIFQEETYLSFSAWIADLTGVQLTKEEMQNARYGS